MNQMKNIDDVFYNPLSTPNDISQADDMFLAIYKPPANGHNLNNYRCQLSKRDSVFILEATIDALGCNIDEIRTEKRKERAENIKIDFQNKVQDVVTLHWDGKLLPALSARKSKEESLPIVTSHGRKKQLIAVPIFDNSTCKEQAQAVWMAILD
ncbi:hypothetical protein AVEN_127552-1 [Araneus ventricosus]|uniref:Uncharacterized protein n=1 Tax=Araneus ventricosus TaxID=182803 RepID=A0A4Y2U183_ARAVE|nr:hypothetical protein AVEN_127552-1 [Araneus ventricosus]